MNWITHTMPDITANTVYLSKPQAPQPTTINTKVYSGNYEVNDDQTGNKQLIHYIQGNNGLVAMVVIDSIGTHDYYTYTDNLGSILTVTDNSANIVAQQSFDAWGRYRNPTDWSYDEPSDVNSITYFPSYTKPQPNNFPTWLYRGYTGHEMLPQFALINMNGRMYDPILGRMLSPDNEVQDPTSTQYYNKYSYVSNNPLKYTDPSGWLGQDGGGWFNNNPMWLGTGMGAGAVFQNFIIGNHQTYDPYGAGSYGNLGTGTNYAPDGSSGTSTSGQGEGTNTGDNLISSGLDIDKSLIASSGGASVDGNSYSGNLYGNPAYPYAYQYDPNAQLSVSNYSMGQSSISSIGEAWDAASITLAPEMGNAESLGPVGGFLQAGVEAATLGLALYYSLDALSAKFDKEVTKILDRDVGSEGFQYSLRAINSGIYPDVRKGFTWLNKGDVWKYGVTTQGENGRYSKNELGNPNGMENTPGLRMVPEFFGSEPDILAMEKIKIYSYLEINKVLPPGNRITR